MHSSLWLTPAMRTAIFFGLLATLLVLERLRPRRTFDARHRLRWPANFGLVITDTAMLWLIPVATVGAAFRAQAHGWGLFNLIELPAWSELLLSWLLLDGAIYWQHRLLHTIRALWPLHRVHHSDIEFDASSGVRFHPAEILLSVVFKSTVVIALGAPPIAVLLLETTVNALALFNHSNVRLPDWLDRALRLLIATPDVHRVHHSVHRDETDSNYATTLTIWDHLFGSYRRAPRDGHERMRIGLDQFRDEREQKLGPLLSQPLK